MTQQNKSLQTYHIKFYPIENIVSQKEAELCFQANNKLQPNFFIIITILYFKNIYIYLLKINIRIHSIQLKKL